MSTLPKRLYPALSWTDAAGELDELAGLDGAALKRYADESAANAREHNEDDVLAEDLLAIRHVGRRDVRGRRKVATRTPRFFPKNGWSDHNQHTRVRKLWT